MFRTRTVMRVFSNSSSPSTLTTRNTRKVAWGSTSISEKGMPSVVSNEVPHDGLAVCDTAVRRMESRTFPSLMMSMGKRTSVPERPVWSVEGTVMSISWTAATVTRRVTVS